MEKLPFKNKTRRMMSAIPLLSEMAGPSHTVIQEKEITETMMLWLYWIYSKLLKIRNRRLILESKTNSAVWAPSTPAAYEESPGGSSNAGHHLCTQWSGRHENASGVTSCVWGEGKSKEVLGTKKKKEKTPHLKERKPNFWTGESFLGQPVNTNTYNSALSQRRLGLCV